MTTTRKFNIDNLNDIIKAENLQDKLYNDYDYVQVVKIDSNNIVIKYE